MKRSYLGKCKSCKGAARLECLVDTVRTPGAYGRITYWTTVVAPNGAKYRTDNAERIFFPCLCGRAVEFKRIRGIKTDHECGAKCLASTGPICECSCGGKNHGASYC